MPQTQGVEQNINTCAWEELPKLCKFCVKRFGEIACCPIGSIGVGPDRKQSIPVPH